MDAVDSYIPTPARDDRQALPDGVEDVFSITGRGTVATGSIERGMVETGDEVEIVGIPPIPRRPSVTGVEMFRKILDDGEAGDNVGLLLRGVGREEIERGQVVVKPGSITPHTRFQAQVYILSSDEGGRHTPFFTGYRPQFYFRTTDVTGSCTLPEGVEMVMPGDNTEMDVELLVPIAMDEGLRFTVREGGRTVGAGRVIKVDQVGAWLPGTSGSAERSLVAEQKIRIRIEGLRSRDHRPVREDDRGDGQEARERAFPARSLCLPTAHLLRHQVAARGQGLARAFRDQDAQAAYRHTGTHACHGRRPDAAGPAGRRGH